MTAITADRTDVRSDAAQVGRLDLYVVLMTIGLAIVVITGVTAPRSTFVSRDLYIALNGLVVGVAAMAALTQWNHYVEQRTPAEYLLSMALVVLALANGARLAITVLGIEGQLGFSADAPGQAPIYAWFSTRLFAAVLFGLAGIAGLRRWKSIPGFAFVVAAVGVLVAIVDFPVARALESMLPQVVTIAGGNGGAEFSASVTPAYVIVNLLVAGVLFFAALRHRMMYVLDGSRRSAFLTLALVIAGFSQIQAGFNPAMYVGLISGGDALRAVFYLFLVLAFQADARATLRDLKESHLRLERLQESELVRAVLEERARLAREVHDGLTQELWLAKLQFGEISEGLGDRHPEFRGQLDEVRTTLDSAIAEARLAIVALSASSEASGDFVATLRTYVEDAGDRLGVPVAMSVSGTMPALPARVSAEVTRIVQEALTNVRKHAEASSATVHIESLGTTIRVTVADDGRGFDPTRHTPGHGTESMRQRAEAIGGHLALEHPDRGTRVVLEFPAQPADAA
jgi:signal transduction histidine kinase